MRLEPRCPRLHLLGWRACSAALGLVLTWDDVGIAAATSHDGRVVALTSSVFNPASALTSTD
eukprot:CAMPEP_0205920306 /NCGR_PEP_ID=MMETSP1325-20131115/10994_1 /ASSEMBLY_ACC=CAM_ASM_000708 /TAXON_ID=236786 /ORGANISM="Florenciella sp., Strain RCC1007" /LENGTH=61 /DNA_ID=CAMNT_0053287985 /DNA_START=185 /DNA_END=367 /DNA_ORIENTATION=-